jgi:hypothetical protein
MNFANLGGYNPQSNFRGKTTSTAGAKRCIKLQIFNPI